MRSTQFVFVCLVVVVYASTNVISTQDFVTPTPILNCGPVNNIPKCYCQGTVANCSGQNLTEIPALPKTISSLIFVYNNLKTLSASTFRRIDTSSIISLNLTGNKVARIKNGVFSGFKNLKNLTLNENKNINRISLANAFKSLVNTKVSVLHLADMHLNNTENLSITLSPLSALNLTEISLRHNYLKHFEDKVFSPISTLEYLDLSDNYLTHKNFTRTGLKGIKKLNLHGNDFFIWAPWLCDEHHIPYYPNLQLLDLTKNSIQLLYKDPWECAKSLTKVYLDYNPVHIIENNTFSNLTALKTVALRHMYNPFMSISDKAFDSISLQHIHLDRSYLEMKKYNLTSIFSSTPNLTYLSLSYNILWNLNSTDWIDLLSTNTRLETLYLEKCQISSLQISSVFEYLQQLKTLSLSKNAIPKVDFSEFGKLQKLTKLNLSHSHIQEVEPGEKNKDFLKDLTSLDLSDNKFSCECDENVWFKEFLKSHMHIIKVTEPFVCGSPHKLKDKNFLEVDPKADCHPYLVVEIAVACVLAFVFLTVAIAGFQARWYIQYWVYRFRRRRSGRRNGYQRLDSSAYDGYVVYHEDDREFVHGPLLDIIENQRRYRLYLPLRDSLPGEVKVDNICDNICNSRKILIVLSNNFLKDSWCKFQLDVVVDRQVELGQEIMFMILLNKIDASKMQKSLFLLLARTPNAAWVSANAARNLFIEKITDSMESIDLESLDVA